MRNTLFTLTGLLVCAAFGFAADPPKVVIPGNAKPSDSEGVERVLAARKEYQASLVGLYAYYEKSGDRGRMKWVEEELKTFHLMTKPSYRLDISDVPPATLEAKTNIKEANAIYVEAMKYKDKGSGTDYTLNQRRAEILLQEILQKYPSSDKIADVAYQLGDIYESRAYKQHDRAAAYFERSYQWRKGAHSDAIMRAAYIYDRLLNERSKAIDLYREELQNDTEPVRLKEAEKRLAELTSRGK
jgi:hypothetical protein